MDTETSVKLLQKYIQIRTDHPQPDYESAKKFIVDQGKRLNLQYKVVEYVPGKPIVILTWPGTNENLKSVLLNSHMDVVPAEDSFWKYPPFAAYKDDIGNIYGRGTQDMKSIAIEYLEAVTILKENGVSLPRTVHLTFVSDEEIGSDDGMAKFVHSDDFKSLNVGFALDEGIATETDVCKVYYAERIVWWLNIVCKGNQGHGAKFVENTAAEKFNAVVNKLLEFREKQKKILSSNPELTIGDVTSVNLTKIEGGVQANIVPNKMVATFDIRIAPADYNTFEQQLNSWIAEIDPAIEIEFFQKSGDNTQTRIDNDFLWWSTFANTLECLNVKYSAEVKQGCSDARFMRSVGIPAIGFSPMPNTPQLLHDHNEFVNEKVFLRGIEIYKSLIKSLGSMQTDQVA